MTPPQSSNMVACSSFNVVEESVDIEHLEVLAASALSVSGVFFFFGCFFRFHGGGAFKANAFPQDPRSTGHFDAGKDRSMISILTYSH